MKSKEKIAELRGMSSEQLAQRSREINEELMRLRFRKATAALEQTHIAKQLKREQARLKTVLTEKAREAGK